MQTLKQKLKSRKFWIGVAVIVVGIVMCCNGDKVHGMELISVGCVTYMGAEGLADIFGIVFSCSFFNEQVEKERAEAAADENYLIDEITTGTDVTGTDDGGADNE